MTTYLYPAAVVFLLMSIVPLAYVVYVSFFSWNLAKPYLGFTFAFFDNYAWIANTVAAIASLAKTLKFVGISVTFSCFIGFGLALLLNDSFWGRSLVRTLLILPMVITPVVTGMMWRFMLEPNFGPLAYYVKSTLAKTIDWLGDPSVAIFSVVVADIWQWTPLVFLIILSALQALPNEVYEAAELDGASSLQRFALITLPLMRTPIVLSVLLRFMDSIRTFDVVYAMTKGGPGSATEIASIFLYNNAFRVFQIGRAASYGILIFVIIWLGSYAFVRVTGRVDNEIE